MRPPALLRLAALSAGQLLCLTGVLGGNLVMVSSPRFVRPAVS